MDTIFCQYCGAPNSLDARFCKNCGQPITATPQPPIQQQPVYLQQNPQQPLYPQYAQQPVYPQQVQSYPQQPNIPLQPAVPLAPPKKKKGRILLIGILFAVLGCCGIIGVYYQLFLKPIQNTGRDFIVALERKDYVSAFSMTSSEVQSQLGSPDGLKTYMESNGLEIASHRFGTLKRISGDPVQGFLMADLTLTNGTIYALEVDMQVGPNNIWQVIGFGPPAK